MMFLLLFVQPRPAIFDSEVPIFENKQHLVEGSGEEVEKAVESFLREGRISSRDATYFRTKISLAQIPPSSVPLRPKPEFLSMDEYA